MSRISYAKRIKDKYWTQLIQSGMSRTGNPDVTMLKSVKSAAPTCAFLMSWKNAPISRPTDYRRRGNANEHINVCHREKRTDAMSTQSLESMLPTYERAREHMYRIKAAKSIVSLFCVIEFITRTNGARAVDPPAQPERQEK